VGTLKVFIIHNDGRVNFWQRVDPRSTYYLRASIMRKKMTGRGLVPLYCHSGCGNCLARRRIARPFPHAPQPNNLCIRLRTSDKSFPRKSESDAIFFMRRIRSVSIVSISRIRFSLASGSTIRIVRINLKGCFLLLFLQTPVNFILLDIVLSLSNSFVAWYSFKHYLIGRSCTFGWPKCHQ
jgi:hypothetical protein